MTDSIYLDQISILLNSFAQTVKSMGRLNLHNINVDSENLVRDLLNSIRGLQLVNANDIKHNEPGIDLVDSCHKIIIQVSSECTKKKLQESLDKTDKSKYKGFHFLFVSLTTSADNLRGKTYSVPAEFSFDASTDILDINSIIAEINSKTIAQKQHLYDLTHAHLIKCVEVQKNPTSLSKIVAALDKALNNNSPEFQKVPFIIPEKIKQNHLENVSGTITDHVIYASMLNKVYSESEQFGKNTRIKIHSVLRRWYEDNKGSKNPCELYRFITDNAFDIVQNSANRPTDMTFEDMQWAVSVVVADAFEECKIFEHPIKML